MPVLDSRTVTVATVTQPTITGQIVEVLYWNSMLSQWQSSAPTDVPIGHYIGVKVTGKNTSSVGLSMWFVITLKRPDGSQHWSGQSTVYSVPSNGTITTEVKQANNMAGQWSCDIQLYGE